MEKKKTGELAYYPGCSLHASSKLYDIQCKLVLNKLGIELREIADWNCCGTSSASKRNDFLAVALPARNLGIAEATGLREMLVPCSSCYSRTLIAQKAVIADPSLRERINAELSQKISGTIKVSNILEVLLPNIASTEFPKKLEGLKPACYYGCLLTRFPCDAPASDNVENPQSMETICEAVGAEPIDWNYKTDCCGASAGFNDRDQALVLMSRILHDALDRGANCIVTSCPLCQLNLDAYQEAIGKKFRIEKRLPVYFVTEIVGLAMGIDPLAMQIDRHVTDAMELLKRVK